MAIKYSESSISKYYGRILNGAFCRELKERVEECIAEFQAFEKTETPAINYISAWKDTDKTIWYEYTSPKFTSLLKCKNDELWETFRKSILEQHIYKTPGLDNSVKKETLNHNELNGLRKKLRSKREKTGLFDAVYKISLKNKDIIWLKDQAIIENYKQDNASLSLGCLFDVTNEMKYKEKCENLNIELKKAMDEIKTLEGLLPICASCKNIRDDKGNWNDIENYISERSDAIFNHGICPDCAKKLYPELSYQDFGGFLSIFRKFYKNDKDLKKP